MNNSQYSSNYKYYCDRLGVNYSETKSCMWAHLKHKNIQFSGNPKTGNQMKAL